MSQKRYVQDGLRSGGPTRDGIKRNSSNVKIQVQRTKEEPREIKNNRSSSSKAASTSYATIHLKNNKQSDFRKHREYRDVEDSDGYQSKLTQLREELEDKLIESARANENAVVMTHRSGSVSVASRDSSEDLQYDSSQNLFERESTSTFIDKSRLNNHDHRNKAESSRNKSSCISPVSEDDSSTETSAVDENASPSAERSHATKSIKSKHSSKSSSHHSGRVKVKNEDRDVVSCSTAINSRRQRHRPHVPRGEPWYESYDEKSDSNSPTRKFDEDYDVAKSKRSNERIRAKPVEGTSRDFKCANPAYTSSTDYGERHKEKEIKKRPKSTKYAHRDYGKELSPTEETYSPMEERCCEEPRRSNRRVENAHRNPITSKSIEKTKIDNYKDTREERHRRKDNNENHPRRQCKQPNENAHCRESLSRPPDALNHHRDKLKIIRDGQHKYEANNDFLENTTDYEDQACGVSSMRISDNEDDLDSVPSQNTHSSRFNTKNVRKPKPYENTQSSEKKNPPAKKHSDRNTSFTEDDDREKVITDDFRNEKIKRTASISGSTFLLGDPKVDHNKSKSEVTNMHPPRRQPVQIKPIIDRKEIIDRKQLIGRAEVISQHPVKRSTTQRAKDVVCCRIQNLFCDYAGCNSDQVLNTKACNRYLKEDDENIYDRSKIDRYYKKRPRKCVDWCSQALTIYDRYEDNPSCSNQKPVSETIPAHRGIPKENCRSQYTISNPQNRKDEKTESAKRRETSTQPTHHDNQHDTSIQKQDATNECYNDRFNEENMMRYREAMKEMEYYKNQVSNESAMESSSEKERYKKQLVLLKKEKRYGDIIVQHVSTNDNSRNSDDPNSDNGSKEEREDKRIYLKQERDSSNAIVTSRNDYDNQSETDTQGNDHQQNDGQQTDDQQTDDQQTDDQQIDDQQIETSNQNELSTQANSPAKNESYPPSMSKSYDSENCDDEEEEDNGLSVYEEIINGIEQTIRKNKSFENLFKHKSLYYTPLGQLVNEADLPLWKQFEMASLRAERKRLYQRYKEIRAWEKLNEERKLATESGCLYTKPRSASATSLLYGGTDLCNPNEKNGSFNLYDRNVILEDENAYQNPDSVDNNDDFETPRSQFGNNEQNSDNSSQASPLKNQGKFPIQNDKKYQSLACSPSQVYDSGMKASGDISDVSTNDLNEAGREDLNAENYMHYKESGSTRNCKSQLNLAANKSILNITPHSKRSIFFPKGIQEECADNGDEDDLSLMLEQVPFCYLDDLPRLDLTKMDNLKYVFKYLIVKHMRTIIKLKTAEFQKMEMEEEMLAQKVEQKIVQTQTDESEIGSYLSQKPECKDAEVCTSLQSSFDESNTKGSSRKTAMTKSTKSTDIQEQTRSNTDTTTNDLSTLNDENIQQDSAGQVDAEDFFDADANQMDETYASEEDVQDINEEDVQDTNGNEQEVQATNEEDNIQDINEEEEYSYEEASATQTIQTDRHQDLNSKQRSNVLRSNIHQHNITKSPESSLKNNRSLTRTHSTTTHSNYPEHVPERVLEHLPELVPYHTSYEFDSENLENVNGATVNFNLHNEGQQNYTQPHNCPRRIVFHHDNIWQTYADWFNQRKPSTDPKHHVSRKNVDTNGLKTSSYTDVTQTATATPQDRPPYPKITLTIPERSLSPPDPSKIPPPDPSEILYKSQDRGHHPLYNYLPEMTIKVYCESDEECQPGEIAPGLPRSVLESLETTHRLRLIVRKQVVHKGELEENPENLHAYYRTRRINLQGNRSDGSLTNGVKSKKSNPAQGLKGESSTAELRVSREVEDLTKQEKLDDDLKLRQQKEAERRKRQEEQFRLQQMRAYEEQLERTRQYELQEMELEEVRERQKQYIERMKPPCKLSPLPPRRVARSPRLKNKPEQVPKTSPPTQMELLMLNVQCAKDGRPRVMPKPRSTEKMIQKGSVRKS